MVLDRGQELSDFLRRLRNRTPPDRTGLPGGMASRRRAPGLRREELAALAGISVDWYTRLEQGRAERPSPSVLDALSRALDVTADERAHLYALARGERPPLHRVVSESVDPSLARVLRFLPADVPAYILGFRWDVLAWNRGACELLVDFEAIPAARRNLVELTFLDQALSERYVEWNDVAQSTLANFRASIGRHVDVPEVQELVAHLMECDARFAAWWRDHWVAEKSTGTKLFRGDGGVPFAMRFESLLSPSAPDQRIIMYSPIELRPTPGTHNGDT